LGSDAVTAGFRAAFMAASSGGVIVQESRRFATISTGTVIAARLVSNTVSPPEF
jgi:hypothetical protein